MNSGITTANIYVSSGMTYAGSEINLTNSNPKITGSGINSKVTIVGVAGGINPVDASLVLAGADVDLGGTPTLSISTTDVLGNIGCIYLDASPYGTIGITGNMRVSGTQTQTGRATFTSGITTANIYVSSGATFNAPVSVSTTSNAIDVIASTDGAGLRIAQATSGGSSRIGAIRLGRSTTHSANVYVEGYIGTFRVYNGLSGTVSANPGLKMFELDQTNGVAFGMPFSASSGVTFNGRPAFIAGLTAANIYVSSGATFVSSISGTTASFSGGITANGYVETNDGYRMRSGTINSQSGTTYTLLSTDDGKIIVWNNANGVTLTVPTGLSVGFNTTIVQTGTGQIGITGTSVTLNSLDNKLKTAGKYATVGIISYSTNVFVVAGGLTA